MGEKIWKVGVWGSTFVILLGLSVIIGWLTGKVWLVQWSPSFAPMYFNSALLLVFLGFGTLFYVLRLRKTSTAIALTGGLFALILLIQRLFDFPWGLNQLFFESSKLMEVDYCGLNTLFSFTCLFSSLLLFNLKNLKTFHLLLIGLLAGLCFAITLVAFWGYVSGIEAAYSWGDLTRMAFSTAMGLSAASLLQLAAATKELAETDRSILPIWSAALVGMILFSTTIAFTRALALHQASYIHQTVESLAKEYTKVLVEKLTAVTNSLDRLSKRNFEKSSSLPDKEWEDDASSYLHDLKGLVGIVKLSNSGDIVQKKWSILTDSDEIEKEIQERAKELMPKRKPKIRLSHVTDRPHLIYVTPKGRKNNHEVGVISIDELLSDFVPEYRKKDTGLTISASGHEVYENNKNDETYKYLEAKDSVKIFNTKWKVDFWATSQFIKNEQSYFPLTAFLFGSLISIFVAILTYMSLKLFEESRMIAARSLARSAFLAQVSHELRTPLSGIIASVDILENTTEDAKQLRLLDIMRSSGQHLLKVVNEVLDLAKLETGKIPLEPSIEDVNKIADDIIALLLPKAKEKGISLELHCNVPKQLYIDPTRLRQILTNLVGNAIKFTNKGSVLVTIGYTEALEKGVLSLEVEDTGVGINKEDQQHLFEKFSPIRRGNVPGSGLGLYITRAIVEMMDGTITFTSTPDLGSTFTVTLPIENL